MTPHIVLTRLGIGVCRPEFFDIHIEYMGRSSALSLSRQTEDKLHWVVATDILAPPDIEERIAALGVPRTHVWRINPLISGMDPLDLRGLGKLAPDGEFILTRLDDDDLLHPDFARLTRQIFEGVGPLAAHSFSTGVNLLSDGRVQRQTYPWIGLGLSIRSGADCLMSPYSVKHTLIPKLIAERGGVALVTDTEEPQWVRSIHADSDSDFRWRDRRKKAVSETMDLDAFGLGKENLHRLCQALQCAEPSTPVTVPGQEVIYSRLELKGRVLAELRRTVRDLGTQNAPRVYALRQAFYSL